MEHPYAIFVDVDVIEVVEALQHVVARIIEHTCAGMVSGAFEEHFIRDAVV